MKLTIYYYSRREKTIIMWSNYHDAFEQDSDTRSEAHTKDIFSISLSNNLIIMLQLNWSHKITICSSFEERMRSYFQYIVCKKFGKLINFNSNEDNAVARSRRDPSYQLQKNFFWKSQSIYSMRFIF
jgi:hypothetical protein